MLQIRSSDQKAFPFLSKHLNCALVMVRNLGVYERSHSNKRQHSVLSLRRGAAEEQKVSVPQALENGGKILHFAAPICCGIRWAMIQFFVV